MGTGGKHRAYQLLSDMQWLAGHENVKWLTPHERRTQAQGQWRRSALLGYLWKRLRLRLENPYKFACFTRFSVHALAREFLSYYAGVLDEHRPDVCVIDHPGFSDALLINRERRIPTFAAFQNLESLDSFLPANLFARGGAHALMGDLANEIRVLRECAERLFISKVETAFVGGLGLPSVHYPYLPVGKVADRFRRIRGNRATTPQRPGFFLMLGSASHTSTYDGFRWFIDQVQTNGIPDGITISIVGKKTEVLLAPHASSTRFRVLGWVDDQTLDDLLVQAQGVLIPQHRGFGALTRFAELSLAGIPIITSRHPTYAIDVPPGVIVADEWEDWVRAMTNGGVDDRQELDDIDEQYANQLASVRMTLNRAFARVGLSSRTTSLT